jgi:large subunit ribosomal protein L19
MNLVEKYENKKIQELTKNKNIPEFQAGDTLRVKVKIIEGASERTQAFLGVVIARRNRGLRSSFLLRKTSTGEAVERKFLLYSPRLESIEVVKRGVVRRAKLYYMRQRSGKAARIKEKITSKKKK